MSIESITQAMQDNNDDIGLQPIGIAYLGDGNGTVIADKLNRLAYYWLPAQGGSQRVKDVAVLWNNSNIPFTDIKPTAIVTVILGKVPKDKRLHIIGQASGVGDSETGGVSLMEQRISQASFPPSANIQDFRASVVGGEIYIAAGVYFDSTGLARRWYGGSTANADTSLSVRIAALSGTGKQQLCWVSLDLNTGTLKTVVNTAAVPTGTLPQRATYTNSDFIGIATSYRKLIPVYLYDGQALAEEDIYRGWDARYSIASAAASGSITVKDGTTTVSSVTVLNFTSGATVSNLGGGTAGIATSGGSGSVPRSLFWGGLS